MKETANAYNQLFGGKLGTSPRFPPFFLRGCYVAAYNYLYEFDSIYIDKYSLYMSIYSLVDLTDLISFFSIFFKQK